MSDYAPEVGPDGRPRPKFGEYATPEEQRARIQQPEVAESLAGGHAIEGAAMDSRPPAAAPTAPARGRGRTFDRVATGVLLGYGLFIVLTSIPTVVDYSGFASTFLQTLGVSATLSDPGSARGWAIAAALVLGVGWLGAAALSLFNLRAGRITFWIPLVAGVICNLASSVLLVAPLMADPVVWPAIQSAMMGTVGR